MDRFRALVASKGEKGLEIGFKELGPDDLMAGDVTVRVSHTTINYKDALALTGKAPIIRKWPLIPGIDFAGRVETSGHAGFKAGDLVVLNGWGVGEIHHGGYSQVARVPGDWLVKLPSSLSPADAMAIGTAGYTAMLCVLALERHDILPASGPVLVTGATGGVGSIAVSVLARHGYHVIAATGRAAEEGYLKSLGAAEIIDRSELSSSPAKPLARERWAGVVDVAGSTTLANAISMTKYGGCVAATGLAQGMDLPGNVAPFILRGVTLAGVDSVMCPRPRRLQAWQRLAQDLDTAMLAKVTQTRPLEDVVGLAPELLAGKVRGRIVLTVA